ncbi:nedd4-binding protein 2 [Holotrichia oblita]|uniref:Nedd4-binding protein 2 n=1 Tax=Holotrichia oblita TaxID=644536 RepID=A0ACB9SQ04_HOLOL|nr:nedd4-binding protein 2 [Holotrichia oblita]
MATAMSSQNLHRLYDMFSSIDPEIIQIIAEGCNYDMNTACKQLYEIAGSQSPRQIQPSHQNPYEKIIGFIRNGYKILILMRGLPGSGKSTLAIMLLSHGLGQVNRDEFIFSTDDYFRKSGNYKYNPRELDEAHLWNQRRCFSSMKRGVSPIFIDNTNVQAWEMQVYCVMATQYGYMIEIATPWTDWALNPGMLANKNSHGVNKKKIEEMMARYEHNITTQVLFKKFSLNYSAKLPQYRLYPPITQGQTPGAASADSVDKPVKKEKKVLVEYVHKFKNRREEPTEESTSENQLIDIPNEPNNEDHNNDDLISFINEINNPVAMDESLMKPNQAEQISKQLEENKELMSKMMALLSRKNLAMQDIEMTMEVSKMEVDQVTSNENQGNKSDEVSVSSSLRDMDDLERENRKLKELLQMKLKSDAAKSNYSVLSNEKFNQNEADMEDLRKLRLDIFSEITEPVSPSTSNQNMKENEADKEELQRFTLSSYMKQSVAAAKDAATSNDPVQPSTSNEKTKENNNFSTVKWNEYQQQVAAAKAGTQKRIEPDPGNLQPSISKASPPKQQKSSVPSFDKTAWGLTENALASWEDPTTPIQPSQPNKNVTYNVVETCEQGTNTTKEDLKDSSKKSNINVLNSTLNSGVLSKKLVSNKKLTFDKGCMTEEEELFQFDGDNAEQINKLRELFPDIPVENLIEVYDKCENDFHWTVELLSTTPMLVELKKKESPEKLNSQQSFSFELNDWNVVPTKLDDTKELDETIIKKKQEEEEAKLLQRKQEALEIKKQLENTVTFGKEHYSPHVWQLKTGKIEPSPIEAKKENTESDLIQVDADMIYISDDTSEDSITQEEDEEDLVELNLGPELVQQLENMFGQLALGDNLKPIVQVPESLARQLHALYLESICRQIENQSDYIMSQLKEDEEFAMKLQEAERRSSVGNNMNEIMDEELAMSLYKKEIEESKNLTPETLALKLTKQKLHSVFPNFDHKVLDEILVAHDNNYVQTVQAIMNSTDQQASSSDGNLLEPPISDSTLNEMKTHSKFVNKVTEDEEEIDGVAKSAQEYREDANKHMQNRQDLLQLAQKHHKNRDYHIAMFYSDLANKELKKADQANQHAAHRLIAENSAKLQKNDTLDLHFQYADSAITSLDIFIDYQISQLASSNKPYGHYYIITGWGKRSRLGRPVLKPLAMKRLRERKVT